MSLQKQNINIPFAQGLDTKSDPKQIQPGKFLNLVNTVFNKQNLLQKRNGYQQLASLSGATTITTYNDSLVGIGNTIQTFTSTNSSLTSSGYFKPLDVESKSMVRRATSQTTVDVAVAPNGLACSTWLDQNGSSYYQISDSLTSQIVVPAVTLPATATMPRAFVLGNYFVVTFGATVAAAPHLQYISIPLVNLTSPSSASDITTNISAITSAYDAVVANNTLYISWNGNDGGGAIRTKYLTSTFVFSSEVTIAGLAATYISVTADTSGTTPVIWVSFYLLSSNTIKVRAYSSILVVILTTTTAVSSITINEITSSATANVLNIFYEVANTYGYSPNAKTDYINKNTVTISGVVGTPALVLKGVGLASKSFYYGTTIYMLATYGQALQPTYFLIDSSGNVIAKLAYSNGGGYLINQILPSVNLSGTTASIGYLFKDLLAATNKTQGVTNTLPVYSQTGINLAVFTFDDIVNTSNIAQDLHLSGGFMWMFDGVKPVEHGFHVYPEDLTAVPHTTGGNMTDQTYFYQVTYEWTDGQGNIHRSAPSVPITAVVSGGGGSGSVTVNIPYYRLTYKTDNKVRLVIYRWSTAQQSYYRVTSISSPSLNVPTSDALAYVDTQADSAILGNDLIYTTGGVIENIAAPATSSIALFKSRLFLVDAEDRNLIWYSKQVIENTPVEMSDLFTIFVAPTTGSQGSTGPITCLSAMDDKLIIFKEDAIYYLTGTGPDNTGANNDFSEAVFITSTVGCSNPRSIVFMPDGLMFQSNKGIWLLSRNLQTTYIGAPVEEFNDQVVTSALTIPGTNQVRMTLDDRITLMYDYYYQQWGSFSNLPALSSTVYQDLHTYLNSFGQLLQETPDLYVDVSAPVLISFKTGWFNFGGLQGFERAYFFYLLAEYLSPHKLNIQIAYDYNPSPTQSVLISPDNFSGTYGSNTLYGGSSYGGSPTLEQWRVFLNEQKCEAFQITLTEVFDASKGAAAGAGFTMSGLDLVVGIKDGRPRLPAAKSVG